MEKETKKYIGGSFKIINEDFYVMSLCIEDLESIAEVSKNGKRYAKVKISKKREPNEYGTHDIMANTWKPNQPKSEVENVDPNSLPF